MRDHPREEQSPLGVCPANVWTYRQNSLRLVARDLEKLGVPPWESILVLIARGVGKWLWVRGRLVRLKDRWRDELTACRLRIERKEVQRGSAEHRELVGYMKGLERCRAQVRALCHSERWNWPEDDDPYVNHYLGPSAGMAPRRPERKEVR